MHIAELSDLLLGTYSSSYWIVPETNICIIQAAALKARAEDSTSLISTTNMMICIFLLKDSVSEGTPPCFISVLVKSEYSCCIKLLFQNCTDPKLQQCWIMLKIV
ncbi:hypothetical protein D1007_53079 [Hordeum vulgare]|nr:hypothetical protein D1007_53079 [Hordeum vulgare]